MKTASHMSYRANMMKIDYQRAVNSEPKAWSNDVPADFGCIDAPECSPAGASYSYELIPGRYTSLQRGFARGGV